MLHLFQETGQRNRLAIITYNTVDGKLPIVKNTDAINMTPAEYSIRSKSTCHKNEMLHTPTTISASELKIR